ncbi:RnfABCDGE type electron transport complex subunit D [Enterococcus sp. BWR-S5]|uniref:RnfABCDGE type electron transport complex subunit D n=1 Tax=Enterococcus sp. BWR-S5 TaxID=2787714 RepID=UPI001921775E|nr:RnfABCDGE type electron transport complex subunit D [Enterococcus sp. BWR-S5]MBL1226165.1 RnfABCDGE type electron transport complex subunit D [Enterococcus sp. BWR-S5]
MERNQQFESFRSKRYPMMEASPHLLVQEKTRNLMDLVLLALLPSIIASFLFYGLHSLLLYAISIITCLASEYLWFKIKKIEALNDHSAIVTATLLAMSLPASVPLWFPILGGSIAIILSKELFGGIGRNILNPALAGRAVLRLLFVQEMSENVQPQLFFSTHGLDVVSSPTPLMIAESGDGFSQRQMLDNLIGLIPGKNAETTALLLLLGGLFLLYKKVITWQIPICMIGTVAILALIAGNGDWTIAFAHIFGGATMLGAFFMATDYSTSPTTSNGQILYGICCGALLMIWRTFTSMPEGMTFVLLIMNCFVPVIDYFVIPKPYGQSIKNN